MLVGDLNQIMIFFCALGFGGLLTSLSNSKMLREKSAGCYRTPKAIPPPLTYEYAPWNTYPIIILISSWSLVESDANICISGPTILYSYSVVLSMKTFLAMCLRFATRFNSYHLLFINLASSSVVISGLNF